MEKEEQLLLRYFRQIEMPSLRQIIIDSAERMAKKEQSYKAEKADTGSEKAN